MKTIEAILDFLSMSQRQNAKRLLGAILAAFMLLAGFLADAIPFLEQVTAKLNTSPEVSSPAGVPQ